MKKLTRKSLDELAQMMPVVSEIQQRMFVGSRTYFDSNGNKIGEAGSGYEIYYLNDTQAAQLRDYLSPTGNITGEDGGSAPTPVKIDFDGFGEPLASGNEILKQKVFHSYAKAYCPEAEVVKYGYLEGDAAADVDLENGKRTLTINSENRKFIYDDRDLKAMLRHESNHLRDPNCKLGTQMDSATEANCEVRAIMGQKGTAEFNGASNSYKYNQAGYLAKKLQELDNTLTETQALNLACSPTYLNMNSSDVSFYLSHLPEPL